MKNIRNKLCSFYRDLPIIYKVFLLFYVQIIIPLIIIGFMFFQKSSSIIRNKSIVYSQDILNIVEVRLKNFYQNVNSISMEALYDSTVYDTLNYSNLSNGKESSYKNESIVGNSLKKIVFERDEIQSIGIFSGENNYVYDSNPNKERIRESMPYSDILKAAKSGDGRLVWCFSKNNTKKSVFATRIIYSRDTFKEVGLLVILIKPEYFDSIFQDIAKNSSENISIVSNDNIEIASMKKQKNTDLEKILKSKIDWKSNLQIDNKNHIMISHLSVDELNWKIISTIKLDNLYAEINQLRIWLYIFIFCSLIVMSLISVVFAMDLVSGIKIITTGMEKMQKGVNYEKIVLERNDELGYFGKIFNEMSSKLDYLVNRIYSEEITRKDAEIKALQAQINPHFLFNTLENINWMAQLSGVPEISNTVTALAKMMDQTIGRDDKLVSIDEEIEYVKNYISIIKNRFGERLEVDINLEDDIKVAKIPRLLIQPIVENAVYHGIEKNIKKGIININAKGVDGNIIIEVMDNGRGIKEDELLALNKKLTENNNLLDSLSEKRRKSIGLENVNRRIKLFYGNEYGVKIKSQYSEYTEVILTIPRKYEEGEESHCLKY